MSLVKRLEQVEIDAWSDLFQAASPQIAKQIGLSQKSFGRMLATATSKIDTLGLNRLIGVGSLGNLESGNFEALAAYYKQSEVQRFFVQAYTGADRSLDEKLQSFGLRYHNNWVKLYRDVSPLTGFTCDLEIKRIGKESADHFGRIVTDAFEWSEVPPEWLSATVGRERWLHYLAYDGVTPVATASMYAEGEVAWIVFASTRSTHRGRGAQAALVAARISDAAKMGVNLIAVETAQQTPERDAPSHRNMLRCGFKEAYLRPNYILD